MRLISCLAVALVLSGCRSAASSGVESAADTVRMGRVLSGLRGDIQVQGRPARTWLLAERMAHYRTPGVSIAVLDGGRIAWARGFGLKTAGTTDSVTAETLFQAASISKPVAATATLRLVAQGTLALDTNVNRYLQSWQVPDNRFTGTDKVTLRRILSHSAGLTVHGFPGYAENAPLPSVVQILNGKKPANTAAVRVDTTPGAIWRYAGGGTTVQQLLLTDVTGEPFPSLLKRLVLDPAGMTHSTYEQPLPESRWPQAAWAHDTGGKAIQGSWHAYPEMAAAGLWTTPTDLSRWALAIAAARAGTDTTLLPPVLAKEMLTEQKGGFGLGPTVRGSGREFRFGHGGSNEGFRSTLVYYPEAGVGAVIMGNSDASGRLIQEIENAIAAEYAWPDHSPRVITAIAADSATLAAVTGVYQLEAGRQKFPLTLKLENGVLMVQVPFDIPEEVIPVEPGAFVGLDSGLRFEVRGDSVVVMQGGRKVAAGRKN
jgi:CubicO group peptidase (beta-lactamase class C family)